MSKKLKFASFNFLPFQWSHCTERNDKDIPITVIRIFGWNEKNESVYVRVDDFEIPLTIELPLDIMWTEGKIKMLIDKLIKMEERKDYKPTSIKFKMLQNLYYAHINKNKEGNYENKKFPYIIMNFRSEEAFKSFKYKLDKEIQIVNLGKMKLKTHLTENSISPSIKMIALHNLPSSSWISGIGIRVLEENKESTKRHEYIVSCEDLKALPEEEALKLQMVYPKILSFDLEVYSSVKGTFPNPDRPLDKVFQIGVAICSTINNKKTYKKIGLVLHDSNDIEDVDKDVTLNKYVEIRKFKNESDLYVGFTKLLLDEDPDILIGYNIFKFDIDYMVKRASELLRCLDEFNRMSSIFGKKAEVKTIKWESKAYGKQEFQYLDMQGRIFIDLLPYIKNSFKLVNYKLETVCAEYLKTNKDPMTASDIFKAYESKDTKKLTTVLKYCIQDAWVVYLLWEKLSIWFDLVESATTNGVPIFDLLTRGQQIKIIAQLIRYCNNNDIAVQTKVMEVKDSEKYEGAYVSDPLPGIYENVVSFDFASLYPSIIQAYNIDYTKLVIDDSIPDKLCHVFEWERHQCCEHDKEWVQKRDKRLERLRKSIENKKKKDKSTITWEDEVELKPLKNEVSICASYRYRFLKADVCDEGIIPTMLKNLLGARKKVRKIIEKNEEEIHELKKQKTKEAELKIDKLNEINAVLDKRQLAYKVSANSMYGAMGIKQGYLPFLPGAMCVTSTGKKSILKVNQYFRDTYKGQIVYNDTDSIYYSPDIENDLEKIFTFAEEVAEDVKKLFPPPMKLEFEGKCYTKFLILTKKRYVCKVVKRNGDAEKKLMIRGIVLKRRDNCKFLRDVYETMIYNILDHSKVFTGLSKLQYTMSHIYKLPEVVSLLNFIIDKVNDLFTFRYTFKDFVITKGMRSLEHKSKSDPVHIHVAKKIISRGTPVSDNSRIEYVLIKTNDNRYKDGEKLSDNAEDIEYFKQHREILRIDYLLYLQRQAIKPIDEVIQKVLKLEDFLYNHFKIRVQKELVLRKIKKLNSPKITIVE